jgi:hypothetical protein
VSDGNLTTTLFFFLMHEGVSLWCVHAGYNEGHTICISSIFTIFFLVIAWFFRLYNLLYIYYLQVSILEVSLSLCYFYMVGHHDVQNQWPRVLSGDWALWYHLWEIYQRRDTWDLPPPKSPYKLLLWLQLNKATLKKYKQLNIDAFALIEL